jgi:signal transduction histidine kinase
MHVGAQRQLASSIKDDPPVVARYVFAISSTLAALFLTALLSRALDATYFFLALTAVMASSIYGGLGPGLAASAVAGMALSPLIAESALGLARPVPLYSLGLFGGVVLLVSLVGSSVRSARVEVEAAQHKVEDAKEDRLIHDSERARLVHELTKALKVRDEFLSIASHELKTPLTVLELQVQSLLRSLRAGGAGGAVNTGSERVAGKLVTIERQVRRMTDLINVLLDVSNIMAGRLKMRHERVDLAELARDAIAHMHASPGDAGCDVTLWAPEPVPGIWDRDRVEGVLANLLSNAMKYGCGRPIHVAVRATGDTAILEVRDQGIGIAETDHARIFDRFERAVPEQYGGMGVGLWIVKQTVEALSGTIKVESRLGEGAVFTVELPREPASSQRDAGDLSQS